MNRKLSETFDRPILLQGVPQHYSWGKIGADSLVARLLGGYDEKRPYAELWIGAHEKGPAVVPDRTGGVTLDTLIDKDPTLVLGAKTAARFANKLPFLLKVLSVGQPLSIQAHPDKVLAAKLHQRMPEHYPDANHKPEVAIALTPLELLYGFRPIASIAAVIDRVPEFAGVLGEALIKGFRSKGASGEGMLLREAHATLLRADRRHLSRASQLLSERLRRDGANDRADGLALKLIELYGTEDVGIFSSYLMNLCTVEPGRMVYIGPNIPHAYLSGDLIECMANSDNVVRAGLTSKFQDADTLLSMLDYHAKPLQPIEPIVSGAEPSVIGYHAPVEEFRICEITGNGAIAREAGNAAMIYFCLSGKAQLTAGNGTVELGAGASALVPAAVAKATIQLSSPCRLFEVSIP